MNKWFNILLIILGSFGLFFSIFCFLFVTAFLWWAGTFNSFNMRAFIQLAAITIITVGLSGAAIVIGSRNSRR